MATGFYRQAKLFEFWTELPYKKNSPLDAQTRRVTLFSQLVYLFPALIENLKGCNFFLPLILDRFAWSYSDSEHSVPLDDSMWSRQLCFLFQVISLHPEYLNKFKYYILHITYSGYGELEVQVINWLTGCTYHFCTGRWHPLKSRKKTTSYNTLANIFYFTTFEKCLNYSRITFTDSFNTY